MTLDLYLFLRKLRRAQRHPDWAIQLFEGADPHVQTFNESKEDTRTIRLRRYRHCLVSYCDELERLGLLNRSGAFGKMHITQPGWDYMKLTLQGLLRLTVVDIALPILVAWITAMIVS